MTQSEQGSFPTKAKSDDGEPPLHEFPSFCPPISLMGDDDKQEVTVPPLYPFPRMRKPQNRGLSMPTVLNIQNGTSRSNNFNFPSEMDDQTPQSPSSALPKLVALNNNVLKSERGSGPTSGRKTSLSNLPKASPLKPVCLQTIVPRRRNASVLAKISNVNSPLQ